jgi:osmotically-inducible protein OsmY
MGGMTTLLGGLTAGFFIARMLDPVRGRRRRALASDQAIRAAHVVGDAVSVTARDAQQRTRGIVASLRAAWKAEDAPDDAILAERVRAKIGGATGHSGAIDVEAAGGRVTLRGPILVDEVAPLVRRVAGVRGVREVIDQLQVHLEPGGVPGLQGVARRGGPGRFELWQEHWSPTARVLAGTAESSPRSTVCRAVAPRARSVRARAPFCSRGA